MEMWLFPKWKYPLNKLSCP